MPKKNGINIHPDFAFHGGDGETPYQKQGEELGFTYEEAKKMIDFGLTPKEVEFAVWMRRKNFIPKDCLNIGKEIGKLRGTFKDGTDIHEDFPVMPFDDHPGSSYQREGKEAGFTREEAEEGIANGFRPSNCGEVKEGRKYGFTGQQARKLIEKDLNLIFTPKKNRKELASGVKQIIDLENILTTLYQSFTNQTLDELTDKALQIFIFQTESKIKELENYGEAKIEQFPCYY